MKIKDIIKEAFGERLQRDKYGNPTGNVEDNPYSLTQGIEKVLDRHSSDIPSQWHKVNDYNKFGSKPRASYFNQSAAVEPASPEPQQQAQQAQQAQQKSVPKIEVPAASRARPKPEQAPEQEPEAKPAAPKRRIPDPWKSSDRDAEAGSVPPAAPESENNNTGNLADEPLASNERIAVETPAGMMYKYPNGRWYQIPTTGIPVQVPSNNFAILDNYANIEGHVEQIPQPRRPRSKKK